MSSLVSRPWPLTRFTAAGGTDAGLQREVNEDRYHVDIDRGLFLVIDGIGGQAAGGRAADVALSMVRARLERQTGPTSARVREAIAVANNEIHRAASTRAEWGGMACVLTIAVVEHDIATIGHVGDTRLYKLRGTHIEKITRDHSPVGEWEDANEISENQAMRHPRRNEVYRDVGSERHEPDDREFVDVLEIPFEAEAALLLCSDGLTDLVDSLSIARIVRQFAGDPNAVVRELIEAANAAGGKDNVTVVYVEGADFPRPSARRQPFRVTEGGATPRPDSADVVARRASTATRLGRAAIILLVIAAIGFIVYRRGAWPAVTSLPVSAWFTLAEVRVVQPTESIAAAIERAAPGSRIIVEPGEYRERIVLKDNVSVVSRVPRGATIRLPSAAADDQAGPAVAAVALSTGDLIGFRIVGDSATPLRTGILVMDSAVSIVDVEVTGATIAGVVFAEAGRSSSFVGGDIHDNTGAGLVVDAGAAPRIANTVFSRNGASEPSQAALRIHLGANPTFQKNTFVGMTPHEFDGLNEQARRALLVDNFFLPHPNSTLAAPSSGDPRLGRR
jgi:serine/threonine protein phosphatase PrpC